MRLAGSRDCGIKARNLLSISLHSMPRGAEPFGASTVLENLSPDLVTMVTVAPNSTHTAPDLGTGPAQPADEPDDDGTLDHLRRRVRPGEVLVGDGRCDVVRQAVDGSIMSEGTLPATNALCGPATRIFATSSGRPCDWRVALTAASTANAVHERRVPASPQGTA